MSDHVHGIHHVTAIAGDAQENLDFYTRVMGMRLVKRSVNQDAPDTYHLFYADGEGRPGTDLTFFPWPGEPGVQGIGQATEVGLAVAPASLGFWGERLADAGVETAEGHRFGEDVLRFRDPHGLPLALVGSARPLATVAWARSPVPAEHQVRGFHHVLLCQRRLEPTSYFLTEVLGYEEAGEDAGCRRFQVDGGGSGLFVDVQVLPGGRRGTWGPGAVHHVAYRVRDEGEQLAVRAQVDEAGQRPTPVIDRFWFRSVYFREPGGVLFELATDGPGFTADEDLEHLGEALILPPWLEPARARIEAALPPLGAAAGA